MTLEKTVSEALEIRDKAFKAMDMLETEAKDNEKLAKSLWMIWRAYWDIIQSADEAIRLANAAKAKAEEKVDLAE